MKYIKTKNGIYEVKHDEKSFIYKGSNMIAIYDPKVYQVRDICKDEIIKESDNIKDLCDRFIVYVEDIDLYEIYDYYDEAYTYYDDMDYLEHPCKLYGVLETDKGLIYAAKLNDERDLKQIF